jgi:hypothetical protein
MASRARHLPACLPCCTGVAGVHGVNGLQCSHEDENTRIVCMKAGYDVRLRSSGQPKPSAAVVEFGRIAFAGRAANIQ